MYKRGVCTKDDSYRFTESFSIVMYITYEDNISTHYFSKICNLYDLKNLYMLRQNYKDLNVNAKYSKIANYKFIILHMVFEMTLETVFCLRNHKLSVQIC